MKKPLIRSLIRFCAPKPTATVARLPADFQRRDVEAKFPQRHQDRDGKNHHPADAVDQRRHRARLLLAHLRDARLRFRHVDQASRQRLQDAHQHKREQQVSRARELRARRFATSI